MSETVGFKSLDKNSGFGVFSTLMFRMGNTNKGISFPKLPRKLRNSTEVMKNAYTIGLL